MCKFISGVLTPVLVLSLALEPLIPSAGRQPSHLSPPSALQQEPADVDASDGEERTFEIFKVLKGGRRNRTTAEEWRRRLEPMTPPGEQERILKLSRTRLVAADLDVRYLERAADATGKDPQAYLNVYRVALRAGPVQRVTALRCYLRYQSLSRENTPISEIEELSPNFPLREIYDYLEHHLQNRDRKTYRIHSYFELEFLFAELLRGLKKLGDRWPAAREFEERPGLPPLPASLSRGQIYKHIFGELLAGWRDMASLDPLPARETHVRRLATVILFHLKGEKNIAHFGEGEKEIFRSSNSILNNQRLFRIEFGLGINIDLQGANLWVANLQDACVTHTQYEQLQKPKFLRYKLTPKQISQLRDENGNPFPPAPPAQAQQDGGAAAEAAVATAL